LSDDLKLKFFAQLPIVAAIFAATQDHVMDFDEAAEDALNLLDALAIAIEDEEED